ncbi:MAG: histidine phosphatase family protein [Burkholderiales bacterium]|nr:histidine phosphatase family protein [Burkholderiales bacterium]
MLYLIRHAEPLNALVAGDAILLSDEASVLTPHGHAQAQSLATEFARLGNAKVFSSTMPRAQQTAEPIAAALSASLQFDARLAERDFSRLTGLSAQASQALQLQNYLSPGASLLGEETLAAQRARVSAWLADHAADLEAAIEQSVIVVCHGGTIEHLFAELIGIPLAAMARYFLACDYACFLAVRPMRFDGQLVYRVDGVNLGRLPENR